MERSWNGTDTGNKIAGRETLYIVGGMWMNGFGMFVYWYWRGKSTGRELLYSLGGRWLNMYGALVEFYWQGKSEVLGVFIMERVR